MSNNNYDKDFTWIGTIVGIRGVRGEVRVKYFTDHPEYYLDTKIFFIESGEKLIPTKIRKLKSANKGWCIIFEGISSRDAAEKIQGYRLFLPDTQLEPLEKGEFFLHQLIGCRVEDTNGFFLGNVTNFLETAANNVFEVQNGKNEFLIPDVPHVVLELDIEKQKMIIDPIPGLI